MRRLLLFGSVFAVGSAVGWVCRDRPAPASELSVENPTAWVSVPTPDGRRHVPLTARRAVPPNSQTSVPAVELGPDDYAVSVNGGTYWLTPAKR